MRQISHPQGTAADIGRQGCELSPNEGHRESPRRRRRYSHLSPLNRGKGQGLRTRLWPKTNSILWKLFGKGLALKNLAADWMNRSSVAVCHRLTSTTPGAARSSSWDADWSEPQWFRHKRITRSLARRILAVSVSHLSEWLPVVWEKYRVVKKNDRKPFHSFYKSLPNNCIYCIYIKNP